MKVSQLVEELQDSTPYKTFIEQNPDAYFCAAFLILDLTNKTEKIQLDYLIPKENHIAAFEFPFNNELNPKIHKDKISQMKPQSTELKVDIDNLEQKVKEVISNNESSIRPTKIIAILSNNTWNLTCMNDHLGIVQIKLDATSEEKIEEFKKGSLMDFMGFKKV